MFKVGISKALGVEYVPLVDDIVRMVCIQATIQIMVFLAGGGSFFTADFVMLVVYIVLGVMLYWLAIRKLVSFY
jgi:hypothetical protein